VLDVFESEDICLQCLKDTKRERHNVIDREEVPEYEPKSFSYLRYILEVAHEGPFQMSEDPWNHCLQNKLSQEKAVWQHPVECDKNYCMMQAIYCSNAVT